MAGDLVGRPEDVYCLQAGTLASPNNSGVVVLDTCTLNSPVLTLLLAAVSPTARVFYCWGRDIYSGLVTPLNATHAVSVSTDKNLTRMKIKCEE